MQDELRLIQELMQELQDKMKYGKDDVEERLSKHRAPVEVEIKGMDEPMPEKDPMAAMNPMAEEESEEEISEMPMDEEEEQSPADKLKSRLMKLRG